MPLYAFIMKRRLGLSANWYILAVYIITVCLYTIFARFFTRIVYRVVLHRIVEKTKYINSDSGSKQK
jgi:hypothetical protein